jgi:imidazoleglycerol-phosphate dehydratase
VDKKHRKAGVRRVTRETAIGLTVDFDRPGSASRIRCGVPFLGHMIELMCAHGGFALDLRARGDTQVDDHHLTEDLGIALGQAVSRALSDRKGIRRYGSAVVPMDEALVLAALDLSGRAHLSYGLKPADRRIKDFDLGLVEEFLLGFTRNVPCTLHVVQLAGRNSHHVVEAAFKAFGRALGAAVERDGRFRGVPSTKGRL